jgi:hypothetical protein
MNVFLVLLRLFALLLALGGIAATGYLANRWSADLFPDEAKRQKEALGRALLRIDPKGREEVAKEDRRLDEAARAFPFLFGAMALALLGAVLTVAGRTNSGAALLLAAVIGPAVFAPPTLIFTSGMVCAGLVALLASILALAAKPRPRPADLRPDEE